MELNHVEIKKSRMEGGKKAIMKVKVNKETEAYQNTILEGNSPHSRK